MQGSWWKVHPETYFVLLSIIPAVFEKSIGAVLLLLVAALISVVRASKWPKVLTVATCVGLAATVVTLGAVDEWLFAAILLIVALPFVVLKRLHVPLAIRRLAVLLLWYAAACTAILN